MSSKARNIVMWVLTVILALLYLLAALGKLTGQMTAMFANWGYPAWFAILVGLGELAGALGLLVRATAPFAAMLLSAIMLGAVYTHISNGETTEALRPILFLAALAAVLVLRHKQRRFGG